MSDIAPAPARRRGTRCPSCGARVTSASSWCSLCFTDLGFTDLCFTDLCFTDLAPEPRVSEPAEAPPSAVRAEEQADAERVADQLLAELAVTSGASTAPRFGFLTTTGGRVVAMLVGTVAATALGFGLLALGGALL